MNISVGYGGKPRSFLNAGHGFSHSRSRERGTCATVRDVVTRMKSSAYTRKRREESAATRAIWDLTSVLLLADNWMIGVLHSHRGRRSTKRRLQPMLDTYHSVYSTTKHPYHPMYGIKPRRIILAFVLRVPAYSLPSA
jgi:hypothetical protein